MFGGPFEAGSSTFGGDIYNDLALPMKAKNMGKKLVRIA